MNLHITINTDNAAFDDGLDGSSEVSRILRQLSTDIYQAECLEDRKLRDINGNPVGSLIVKE